jgi:hypothetical protein
LLLFFFFFYCFAKKSKGNCFSIPAKLEQTQEECAGTTL